MFINGACFLFLFGGQPASQACGVMTDARILGKPQDWQGDSCGLCFCGGAVPSTGRRLDGEVWVYEEPVNGGGFFGRVARRKQAGLPGGKRLCQLTL